MERKITKKLIAMLMIITILATDFYVLGSNLVTYASQIDSETNNSNVEFSVYFKKENKRVDSIESSIKEDNLKLYAEIKVKNEGYLKDGATIELLNGNFNIVKSNIGIIEDNKIILNQISTGETKEIELNIKPIISDKIEKDMLSMITTVKLSGKYIYSQDNLGEEILTEKEVSANFVPDETAKAELETDIITNKVLSVGETNKRIVQVSVKSRLADNQYPVKQTTINVDIPKLGEQEPEVSVLAVGKLATNGLNKIEETEYKVNDGKLQITLKNEADENNQISWTKDAYDEIVVTYIYPEDVDASVLEVNCDSEIKLQNSGNTYTAKYTKGIENKEPNSIIMGKTEITTKELYKGPIYANIETEYKTKTTIIIGNAEVAEEIIVKENAGVFGTEGKELEANTKYKTTEIDLNKMLEIFGQDGKIEIKNGETTTTINKDTKVNENGKVVINHENSAKEIEIKTSKPEKAGIIEIEHTKIIAENKYTREEIKNVKEIKATSVVTGYKTEEKVVENTTETASVKLKETITKAELTIENNKQTLSTTEENEVILGITLITDGPQYDLYKNPEITIQLPADVKNVEFIEEPSKINADEFEIISKQYDSKNKTIKMSIKGQQTQYAKSSATQAYIQLNLKITLEQVAITHTDAITMTYVNENASLYHNDGVVKKEVTISGPSKVITKLNLSSNENKSLTDMLLQQVKNNIAGSALEFEIGIVNNKDSNINNVRILGKLPTTGNVITDQEENSLETTLKNISAQNATVYYTENSSATEDIENSSNGWTQEFLANAKLYLIKLDSINKGDNYTANITIQLPNQILENTASYTEYKVIYDTENEKNVKESSRKIGLISSLVATIKTEITAQVGQEKINDGGKVKEGEVIKYTATVINKGNEALKNVQLKANVPEGTVVVKPIQASNNNETESSEENEEEGNGYSDGYVYAKNAYYEEITDSKRIEEITTITISELKAGEEAKLEYEVRVNKGTSGKEIQNSSIAIYDGSTIQSKKITNIVKEANIRVTIKRTIDESIQLVAGGTTRYKVYVENMSNATIKDLDLKILSNAFKIEKIENDNIYLYGDEIPEKLNIAEIKANEIMNFSIYGSIAENTKELNTTAIVFDSNGEKYRANLLSEKLPYTNATISLTSPQNGQYIKQDDIVEYNITAKNTGDIDELITVDDTIPSYLQIQSISVNNENTENYAETISNHICKEIILKPNESVQIKVIAKVGYISELYHGKVITNYAVVKACDILKDTSERVTHVLQANKVQENVENIINGLIWFDSNENGKIDVNENVLSDMNVKIYNLSTNGYLIDDHGGIIETKTNSNGEYTFTKIENGSYLIIIECDSKYEPTLITAEGVDTTINSKATFKEIELNGKNKKVIAIEAKNLTGNIFNMNIGLKGNKGNTDNPDQPVNPDTPNVPEKPDIPSQSPEEPEKPDKPTTPEENKKTISGLAWLDANRNGKKDEDEVAMSGIKVKIYNEATKNYLVDDKENIVKAITDDNGKYIFRNIEIGKYILVFEYDTEKYKPTIYLAEGVDTTVNSKVVLKKITVNEKEISTAVTDIINVENDVQNINIGLQENLIFDLELNKYISKIVVQTSKETKTYNYDNQTFAKAEIHRKQISGANVILEYTIAVKNTGEISGYAKNIVDYLPSGLIFSSELNTDWYLAEGILHTKSLENVELKPGEEKEVKLILTKTMTSENVGLINNRAEIYQDYNKYGESDIDSTPNNLVQNEDDFGTVDVIIEVATGGGTMAYTVLLMINIVLIGIAIKLMIENGIIRFSSKKGRR